MTCRLERMKDKVKDIGTSNLPFSFTNLNSMIYSAVYVRALPTECFYPGFRSFE